MKLQIRVLGALWLFQVVNYLDRVVISFAGPSIMKSLAVGPSQFGIVLSSFALGYFLAQIPGGFISDRWGTKSLLVIAPLFWALFTGMTGLAATVAGFVAVRLCFGLAEGISNAACWKVLGDYFAPHQRPAAGAIWLTAIPLAPAIAGPLMTLLLKRFNWHAMFFLLVIPAVFAALVNFVAIPGSDGASARPVATPTDSAASRAALREAFGSPSLWILAFSYLCYFIAYWGYVGWMPSYLALSRGLNLKSVGLLGSIPFFCGLVGLMVVGVLGSTVLKRHLPQLTVACYLFAALFFYIAYSSTTLQFSLAGLSGAAACLYGALSSFGGIVLDLAPVNSRASYSSVVTAFGQAGGVIAPAAIGYLVGSSKSFVGGFLLMIGSVLVAAVCILAISPALSASRLTNQLSPATNS